MGERGRERASERKRERAIAENNRILNAKHRSENGVNCKKREIKLKCKEIHTHTGTHTHDQNEI